MNPIHMAAQMMGKRTICRRATAKQDDKTVFLWELTGGAVLELVRGKGGFSSVQEKSVGFDQILAFYQRSHARVFCPNDRAA